jgi:cytochrome b pre-mRNA-processing protein 3
MLFAKFFQRTSPTTGAALRLYRTFVEKAREPVFYSALAVPDTVNGRFDMVVIHAMLVLRHLRDGGVEADAVGKALLELLFTDMDQSLREMGIGDMGIKHHIKRMAKALFGRAAAYENGLDTDPAALFSALKENLYRHATPDSEQFARMSDYLGRAAQYVASQNLEEIIAGQVDLAIPVLGDGGNHAR